MYRKGMPFTQEESILWLQQLHMDLMTSYNGQTITYDTIGNPLQYRDGMTMTWQNGRQLAGISKSGLTTSYTYNGDGIRTGKTVNGVKTSYIVDGSTIVSQQDTAGHALHYLYDENGKVYGFYCSDAIYYYEFNGQSDVVSLLNHHGDLAASYTYDAWGKLLTVTDAGGNAITDANNVANLNIFRYRGYCYDTETGLYYLQSRYYDPNTGRFVNADGTVNANQDLKTNDLFVYCGNNPVNNSDYNGQWYMGHTDAEIIALMTEDGTMNSGYDVVADLGNRPGYMSDDAFNRIQEKIKSEDFESGISNILSDIAASTSFIKGDMIDSLFVGGLGLIASLPFSLCSQWEDPFITKSQKWDLTYADLGEAAFGICLTLCLATGPVGWIGAGIIGAAWSLGTAFLNNKLEDQFKKDNGWNDFGF